MEEDFNILSTLQARNKIDNAISDSHVGGAVYSESLATTPCVIVEKDGNCFNLKVRALKRNMLDEFIANLCDEFANTNYEVKRTSAFYFLNSKKNTLVVEIEVLPIC